MGKSNTYKTYSLTSYWSANTTGNGAFNVIDEKNKGIPI
jgi:hypothetical protein